MPETIGLVLLAGAEAAGATGAAAFGGTALVTVGGTTLLTGAGLVGAGAFLGAPVGAMQPLTSEDARYRNNHG